MKKYKTTKTQYEYFKKRCLYYMEKFGLNQYDVQFEWKNLDEKNFDVACNWGDATYCCIFYFDTEIENNIEDIKKDWRSVIDTSAKHECIHILLKRFSIIASARYVIKNEVEEAEEELTRRLEKLLT